MRRRGWVLAAIWGLLLSFWAGAVPAASAPGRSGAKPAAKPAAGPGAPAPVISLGAGKLMTQLADRLASAPDAAVFDVVVQFTGPATPALYRAAEQAVGAIPYKARWEAALSGFAATLTARQIRALQALPAVRQIDLDLPVHAALDTSTQYTGVRQARSSYGIDGSRGYACCSNDNVVVAVIDTGIDATHVDLAGKVIGWVDEVNGLPNAYDDNGHGSHVAGIIAGRGKANPAYAGNAPGAALVGIKVLDAGGSGSFTTIINGINWLISNRAAYNIRAANLSLGGSGCADGTDLLSRAVDNAVQSGIVMVVAAGNSGPGTCTVSTPAAAAGAITVGASADPGRSAGKAGWYLANFSGRGPTLDGRSKPDVVAPGVNITSVQANSTDGYVAHSGTSMAAPQVAGIAALMLEANNGLTPSQVKGILTGTATDWGPAGSDSDYGAGLVRGFYAIRRAGGYSTGVYSDGTRHRHDAGSLPGPGNSDYYGISVSSTARPIALTLIMQGCTCDFDLYLYDPDGNLVDWSEGTTRQEQIGYLPAVTGTYTVEVASYSGSGSYDLDESYR